MKWPLVLYQRSSQRPDLTPWPFSIVTQFEASHTVPTEYWLYVYSQLGLLNLLKVIIEEKTILCHYFPSARRVKLEIVYEKFHLVKTFSRNIKITVDQNILKCQLKDATSKDDDIWSFPSISKKKKYCFPSPPEQTLHLLTKKLSFIKISYTQGRPEWQANGVKLQ